MKFMLKSISFRYRIKTTFESLYYFASDAILSDPRKEREHHSFFIRKQVSQEISGVSRNNIAPIDIGKSSR